MNGIWRYEKVCTNMKFFENYILVHTSMYWYDGYHGMSRYMAVYHGIWWYEMIETSTYKYIQVYHCIWLFQDCIKPTYWYILVHNCDMNVHTLINWSLLPVHQAGPPESSGFAALKRHTSSHTHTSLFKFGSDYLPSRLCLPVGAGRKCRPWAGPLPTLHCKFLRPTGISAMLHWCSRNSFCFHLVSRVRTTTVGPARQHASICQMRHGFSHQQTSKSTTWK